MNAFFLFGWDGISIYRLLASPEFQGLPLNAVSSAHAQVVRVSDLPRPQFHAAHCGGLPGVAGAPSARQLLDDSRWFHSHFNSINLSNSISNLHSPYSYKQ